MSVFLTILTSVIATLVGAFLIYGASKLIKWIIKIILGHKIFIVGDGKVGKSSFYNYLRYDEFADTIVAIETLKKTKIPEFDITKKGGIKIHVKKAIDIPGEIHPNDQIIEFKNQNPEVLLVVVSAQKSMPDTIQWLNAFLIQLTYLLSSEKKMQRNLKSVIIILNKIDLLNDGEIMERSTQLIEISHSLLDPTSQKYRFSVKFYPCTLFKNKNAEIIAYKIVQAIVMAFEK